MAFLSEESKELKEELLRRGYDPKFCELISNEMRTSWTANRMLGYLRYFPMIKEEDIVDEMLCILSDRDRIRQKAEMEEAQSVMNQIYRYGLVDQKEGE